MDRRSFIGSAAAGATIATVAVAVPAAAFAAPSRPWDRAMQRMIEAKRATYRYDAEVWDPAFRREIEFERQHGVDYREPGHHAKRLRLIDQHGNAHCIPDAVADEQERLCDAYCNAQTELMGMPAPDRAALRWKLDLLLEPDADGSTGSWSRDYIRQTVADYQRLLGDA